jgi:hypothetical protein
MTYPVFASGDVLNASDMNGVGLWLVKSQAVGTGVSSVTVTGAFSADYDNYRIIISGGVASATTVLQTQLGATATGYYYGGDARTYAGVTLNVQGANVTNWYAGEGGVNTLEMDIIIKNPFTAKNTTYTGQFGNARTDGYWLAMGGYLANTTSYTAFTITPSGGATLTGGTIRVYGYRN